MQPHAGPTPVPFMPVLSRILLTRKEPSSSFLARMSALISIRKLSSSLCAHAVRRTPQSPV